MDNLRNMEERFTYDRLDRLTGIIEGIDTTGVFTYDGYGRMTMKRLHGAPVFDNTAYGADGRPHALAQAQMYSILPHQRIRYTSFDKIHSIQQTDDMLLLDRSLRYDYGYDHQRIRMTDALSIDTVVKEYVGSCEFVQQNGAPVSERTFLSGPLGVFAVLDSHVLPVGKALYYVHPDHLGSWTTVTDRVGAVVQDVRFDPWGTPYYSDSTHLVQATALLFERGFTGHEHMTGFGLVNMNGRVYDPVTSTFLSVDNYVQDPSYTQNFNRYAYCMNNPLKYTDPDGEWIQYLIGGLLGAWNGYSIGKNAGLKGWDLVWSTVGGATVGALSGGVGTQLSSVSTAAIGGLCGGAISGAGNGLIQGLANNSQNLWTDIGNGFWKGGVSGLVGGYVGGGIGIYGGWGALCGGTAASLTSEICNYVTIDNYKINWLNVGIGGAMSYGVYHAQAFTGYLAGGFNKKISGINKSRLTYSEYCDLLCLTQQSMREEREGKFIAYFDKKPLQNLAPKGVKHQVETVLTDYVGAKTDYHTHTSWGSNLEGGEGGSSLDYLTSQKLYDSGYSNTRYLGTREGHIWYLNTSKYENTYIQNQQRIPYDYNSLFYYYQHLINY